MLRSVETMIGLRYLRSRQSTRFASFISAASLLGVAIGVAALITILSVMNGFEAELRSRLLGMQSHATLDRTDGYLNDWELLRKDVLAQPAIVSAAPVVDVEGMVNVDGQLIPLIAQGIDPELEGVGSGIQDSLVSGSLNALAPGSDQIVIGRYLAIDLGLMIGDDLQLLVPTVTTSGLVPRLQQLTVAGIFDSGVPEYDAGAAYLHWEDAAALLGKPGRVAGLKLRFDEVFSAPIISRELRERLGGDYQTTDWTQQNASYFRAIRIEKAMMALILSLVIGVAAFNIIASLVMVVTDKETDIAILRTMGLSAASVVRVFLTQGLIIAWLGVLLGVVGGVLLAANVTVVAATLEQWFGFQVMPGDVYVMSAIPSEIHWNQVLVIAVSALLITTFATFYPSKRAAAVHPAEALRYG
ncbi:MAG: lipoprotein-releasing ABC transporter permease subunit [Woeseiaceae bacterium]